MEKQSKTHVEAVERLEGAREEHRRRAEQHNDARGSSDELSAQANLQTAGEQFAAREAWVKWTERDY
jgi:hypothetical protein